MQTLRREHNVVTVQCSDAVKRPEEGRHSSCPEHAIGNFICGCHCHDDNIKKVEQRVRKLLTHAEKSVDITEQELDELHDSEPESDETINISED